MSLQDDLVRLQGHVKSLIAMRKRQAKLSEQSHSDPSPARARKIHADQAWLGMEIDKTAREAHAAAVDCGIADSRPDAEYEPVEYYPSAFHRYRHTPSAPKQVLVARQAEEAYCAGKEAAGNGTPYGENPYPKDSDLRLAWSKGHNAERASRAIDRTGRAGRGGHIQGRNEGDGPQRIR